MLDALGTRARTAARTLRVLKTADKNRALKRISDELINNIDSIVDANNLDIAQAKEYGLSDAMVDRLRVTPERIRDMSLGVLEILAMDDPVGEVLGGRILDSGITMRKVSVPIGVIGIIYESRPNVTVDAAALSLKSGNAVILRGGKEAIRSNMELCRIMRNALSIEGVLPVDAVQLVEDTSRTFARELMRANQYLDLLIPRGGAGLIQDCVEHSSVPIIETGTGNCHIFVDKSADISMAVAIVDNAKTSRPSVCNAAETLLVHSGIAQEFLRELYKALGDRVELRCCDRSLALGIIDNGKMAVEDDYIREFLDYTLAVKIVDSLDEAVEHISRYSSGHSDCIITQDIANMQYFEMHVDSAAVYVNASTRFTDGGAFGMGAEIGISTQKLHCRGPMGLNALTTWKYLLEGNGQIRI